MLYSRILEGLKKNKAIREGGKHLGIPIPFPRLAEQIPLIEKSQSIGILGATGSGKSPLVRYLYLYTPYKFYKETGYKVKIWFFCLEDSVEKVYHHCMCNYLYLEHGIIITPKELNSKTTILPDFVMEKIEEAKEYFAEFEEVVTFVWDTHTPKGIFEILKDYALKTGTPKVVFRTNADGTKVKQSYYESDTHTIVVFDNMANLDTDPDDNIDSERQAMISLARDYSRKKLVNYFNFTVVQVIQLDFQTERQQFTHSGMTIVSKLEPSLAGIGEAKTISRSMHLVLGLFDPSRYELLQYPIPVKQDPDNCYRIDILGNRFRAIKTLKNNDGEPGRRTGLMFDPIAETFTELPKPKTPELIDVYNKMGKKGIKPIQNSITEDEIPF